MIWISFTLTIYLASIGNCVPLCQRNPGGIAPLDSNSNNGDVAGIGEYPWIVGIEIFSTVQCAGALILPQVAVTTAHCVAALSLRRVISFIIVGAWNLSDASTKYPPQRIAIDTIQLAQDFNYRFGDYSNDISVLFLVSPVRLNEFISTVCLTTQAAITEPCFLTGWGGVENDTSMSQVPKNRTLAIVDRVECEKSFANSDKFNKTLVIPAKQFCAGGRNVSSPCKGDEGAPLVCPVNESDNRYILVGLSSWGMGCGSDFPGVYTNVSVFVDWINKIVEAEGFNSSDYLI